MKNYNISTAHENIKKYKFSISSSQNVSQYYIITDLEMQYNAMHTCGVYKLGECCSILRVVAQVPFRLLVLDSTVPPLLCSATCRCTTGFNDSSSLITSLSFCKKRLIHLDKNWKIKREFGDEIKKAKKKVTSKKVYSPVGI